jgi:hypothetical protein
LPGNNFVPVTIAAAAYEIGDLAMLSDRLVDMAAGRTPPQSLLYRV